VLSDFLCEIKKYWKSNRLSGRGRNRRVEAEEGGGGLKRREACVLGVWERGSIGLLLTVAELS
jgi:hypothetical protein